MPFADETELLARLRTGDDEAYAELVRTHSGAMLGVARRYFGDAADAAEAVQDAFVSAFRAMGRFEGTSRLGTWLHRIAVNACLLRLRGRKRSRLVPLVDDIPAAAAGDDALITAEAVGRVRAGLAELPGPYREVIRLRDLEGLDTEATAARLGTTTGVVKTRLHRARHALRQVLEALSA